MIAAHEPVHRPPDAKLLFVRRSGNIEHRLRMEFVDLLQPGDLVVANDAATLPASLCGIHIPTGRAIEVRLAARRSLERTQVDRFTAVVFGAGDHRTRTEDRLPPPELRPGDQLALGRLRATVERLLDHPRLICVYLHGSPQEIWASLARHGKPIQYAHVHQPLALHDTWSSIAAQPAAFEPPSAGFMLSWGTVAALAARGIGFATLTHAAGLSSTGDPRLDARFPLDEPYNIPKITAAAISAARMRGDRIIAVGTTVVRALEAAAWANGQILAGPGLARLKLGPETHLRVVEAIVSGTHENGTSHHELLRAFVPRHVLAKMDELLDFHSYRTHEFGDSVLIERNAA
ncbi:MAG: S-adenosylmethionine:tRNA ribosyltransferase-isomerase [Proteobacteria bacterium]|nr:S-adenosylmethionine:tRNA ribosyltransferase-isomerase [Pseudomonadota bacterium]